MATTPSDTRYIRTLPEAEIHAIIVKLARVEHITLEQLITALDGRVCDIEEVLK